MKKALFIEGKRNGYDTEQCGRTLTVGQLIELLGQYDDDRPIYLRNDNGYTYGSITEFDVMTEEDLEVKKMRNKYRIVDIDKGLMADDTYIYAKSPLEAVRHYAIGYVKDEKSIVRDYDGKGRFVVYGNGKSFVYRERQSNDE